MASNRGEKGESERREKSKYESQVLDVGITSLDWLWLDAEESCTLDNGPQDIYFISS